ncbi:hypothetical protein LCGC14_1327660 [marine sediment metagenome]|uniref:Uncharacterized protein n=1 Tax=marine sediment metagenome TaxID=412755 RepID=A0A0F9NK02_9ZZZZ
MAQDPGPTQHEAYKALDDLLTGVSLLPLGQVTSRPVLHKAIDSGIEVLDRAVREGRYVLPPRQR